MLFFKKNGSCKQVVSFKLGQNLGVKDHVLTYHKSKKSYWMSNEDYEKSPDSLSICELKKGGALLITTMPLLTKNRV